MPIYGWCAVMQAGQNQPKGVRAICSLCRMQRKWLVTVLSWSEGITNKSEEVWKQVWKSSALNHHRGKALTFCTLRISHDKFRIELSRRTKYSASPGGKYSEDNFPRFTVLHIKACVLQRTAKRSSRKRGTFRGNTHSERRLHPHSNIQVHTGHLISLP